MLHQTSNSPGAMVRPFILPVGVDGLLVRFADKLSEGANVCAIDAARAISGDKPAGVLEVVPSLVSVYFKYDPHQISFDSLAGEVRLRLSAVASGAGLSDTPVRIEVAFDGEWAPDLADVASACGLTPEQFIQAHNRAPLRVIAVGFAPGFIYCGLHPPELNVPRRKNVRNRVPAGSILFAAGQTAIASTDMPTGWHVIGKTGFRNFFPAEDPPVRVTAGQRLQFASLT